MNRFSPFRLAGPIVLAGLATFATIAASPAQAVDAKRKCFFISSYHPGYDHSDAIERGLRATLDGKCEVRQFNMDAKRKTSEAERKDQAAAARGIIESWQPDIVITADDEAAKYVIQAHYKDAKLPFVFCGINWTATEYGFPYNNATGMIEVAPIVPMIEKAAQIVPSFRRAFYLGSASLTEEKNLARFERASKQLGFQLDHKLVPTTEAWIETYAAAQEYDVVIVGNSEGIKDWDPARARAAVLESTRRLSVTNHDWMMPWTILGVTKVSEEQGEWAARTALRILDGVKPAEIPVVPNSRRDFWINDDILAASRVQLPRALLETAKKVAGLEAR
ncbi:MAG: ABC transporter substrate-binding protein [Rhodospirillales bacterium]